MKRFVNQNIWLRECLNEIKGFPIDCGWGNGYVLIPQPHPWFNLDHSDLPVYVHGGLTYGSIVSKEMLETWSQLSKDDIGKHMVGFDTGHNGDNLDKWPREAVVQETKRLHLQILRLGKPYYLIE